MRQHPATDAIVDMANSYEPVISKIIITAVTGAPMMAPPTAAIPQKGKIEPAPRNPKVVKIFPRIEPVAVPMKSAGENTPPYKPVLKHTDVIKILSTKIAKTKVSVKVPLSISTILCVPKPKI